MTRLSTYLLPTERKPPADAQALSHRLMVRAGLIRQVGAGLWSWLPAGWRAHQRVVAVIREEMDRIGGQEVLLPLLQPIEPWQRTGRSGIPELFKLRDRREAELVLAMTHEELMTLHVASLVRSYRQLPLILYHFQLKARDEPRPRGGVLRTREFIMKDSYSFDRDQAGMEESYARHVEAYDRIMDRLGLRWYRVESDVGMMGGLGAHEYMAPCPAGENEVALAPGYAANVEVAKAQAKPVALPPAPPAPRRVATPGLVKVEEVAAALGKPPGGLLKAFPVEVGEERRLVLALVRGDHRVNELKLAAAVGGPVTPAPAERIAKELGPPGFLGPVGLDHKVEILLDEAVAPGGYVTGANEPDAHLEGVVPGRDFAFRSADIRRVEEGDTVSGRPISIEPAIEVANIFKLGTRYSAPLGARYLDERSREREIWMGSYGIGPARIVAAAVEQHADERGISWPRALAPFDLQLIALGKAGSAERELAEALYPRLQEAGFSVLYDDREVGAGEKFTDAELLGLPLRLVVGRKAREEGLVEVVARRGMRQLAPLPVGASADQLRAALEQAWEQAP